MAATALSIAHDDLAYAGSMAPFDTQGMTGGELRALLESGRPSLQRIDCIAIATAMNFGPGTAYAYPCSLDITFLRQHGRRLVECGSGSGLYAAALRRNGFDVVATDPRFDANAEGRSRAYFFTFGTYSPMAVMDGTTAVDAHPDRDVLIIAPDPMHDWPAEAIRRMTRPGRRVFIAPDCKDFMSPTGSPDSTGFRLAQPGIPAIEQALCEGFRPIGKSMPGFGQIYGFERI